MALLKSVREKSARAGGVATACLLLMAGCASGPDYESVLPQAPAQEAFAGAGVDVFSPAAPQQQWWRLYEEPALSEAVEEALAANADLRAVTANLRRSRAVLRESRRGWLPGTTVNAGSTSGRQNVVGQGGTASFEDTIYSASLDISWQVDLFGRVRRAVEAADADAEASRAAWHAAQVTVAGETALAWVEACAAGFQLQVARNTLGLQQQTHDLTRQLLEAGRGTALDVSSAAALLEQLRAELPTLEAERRAALYRLALLLGRPPARFPAAAAQCAELPLLDEPIPVGDGASLLARRPDVRQAERELAAATARTGVAAAQLYPSVTLGASVGSLALAASDLGEGGTARWSLGPLLSWSFPNNTLARARVAQAEAAAEAALARFDSAWLDALRETETVLAQYSNELRRVDILATARDHSAQAAELANARFQAGQLSLLDVLQTELSLANAEMARARSRVRVARLQVALFLALGGGWSDSPPTSG